MGDRCDTCRAPVVREGDRVQFDSSRYHMDAVKKLSEISALNGYVADLEDCQAKQDATIDRLSDENGRLTAEVSERREQVEEYQQQQDEIIVALGSLGILRSEIVAAVTRQCAEGSELKCWIDSLLADSGPIHQAHKVIHDHFLFSDKDPDEAMRKIRAFLEAAIDGNYDGAPASGRQKTGRPTTGLMGEALAEIDADDSKHETLVNAQHDNLVTDRDDSIRALLCCGGTNGVHLVGCESEEKERLSRVDQRRESK